MHDRNMKPWILSGALAYAAVLAVVCLGLFGLYDSAQDRLDAALGERLESIATTAAHLVDGDALEVWTYDPYESLDFIWLRSRLQQIRRENTLSELTLCDPDGLILISAADRLPKGEINAFWDVDPAAVASAREGFPAASRLYRSGGLYQKSAHAPVRDSAGTVAGVISVEAEADFFTSLRTLRRAAFLTGLGVLVFLSIVAALLAGLLRAIMRYRASILRQENLAAMGRMTAGIAHEIRNPLGIIRGAGELQARRLREEGIALPTTEFIPEEVDRLDRILSRYLAFGKGGGLEKEALDIGKLARRVARNLEDELGRDGVRIEFASGSGLPMVQGDSPGLQQVFLNLFFNARDAMPSGGLITVDFKPGPDVLEIRIADQGAGLGGRAGESLFEPFRTTREKGSGLGLAVVRQVVEDHGGRIRLVDRESEDGCSGAVAIMELPIGGA